jgi:hypothetical protein
MNGVFLIIELLLVLLYFIIIKRRFVWQAVVIWLIFSGLSLVVEHDFIQSLLFKGSAVSHRSAWNLYYLSSPIRGVVNDIISMFLHGQYHAPSHQEVILFVILLALLLTVRSKWSRVLILCLLGLQLLIAMIYGWFTWDKLIPIKSIIGVFSTFNWGRIHWLSPFIWYCLFFFLIVLTYNKNSFDRKAHPVFSLILIGLDLIDP